MCHNSTMLKVEFCYGKNILVCSCYNIQFPSEFSPVDSHQILFIQGYYQHDTDTKQQTNVLADKCHHWLCL